MITTSEIKKRAIRKRPRTFEHFPEKTTCPICGTNDDGESVLVEICGTREGGIAEAVVMHLACAVVRAWDSRNLMASTWSERGAK